MAETRPQDYASHRQFRPGWHFVAVPILLIQLIVTGRALFRDPSAAHAWDFVLAIGLNAGLWTARTMALAVQDRVIRLEMRLRLREVLPAELQGRIGELTRSQLIGLRFAGDAELPGLVQRCLAGELVKADDVKKQVVQWQPDFLRA